MKAKVSIKIEYKQSKSLRWWFYITTISSMGVVKIKLFESSEEVHKYLMNIIDANTHFYTKNHKYMEIALEKEYEDTSIIC